MNKIEQHSIVPKARQNMHVIGNFGMVLCFSKFPFLNSIFKGAIGTLFLAVAGCSGPKSEYLDPPALAVHYGGETYVGSESCMECHSEIYKTHLRTAHHNTSMAAAAAHFLGSFDSDSNSVRLQDAKLTMVRHSDEVFQLAEGPRIPKEYKKKRVDVVVGSGVKGQSFLAWEEDKLYQLQTSYYVPSRTWVNSPNYPSYFLDSPRAISDLCLKCHTTFAKNSDSIGKGNTYPGKNILFGIECERCHNPALGHVKFHRSNPAVEQPHFMVRIDTLLRNQRIDVCAQCHSGLRNNQKKGNPFSFQVGESLSEYSSNYGGTQTNRTLDVHGNQVGLLQSSACFKNSNSLECTTCHNPHVNQRGNREFFNAQCTTCHNVQKVRCSVSPEVGHTDLNDCVSCHMPVFPSKTMQVQSTPGMKAEPVGIRTHQIAIYAKELWEKGSSSRDTNQ